MPFYPTYLNIHWKAHRRGGIIKIMLIMFSISGLEIWGDMCLLCKTSLSVCQLLQSWASNPYVLSGSQVLALDQCGHKTVWAEPRNFLLLSVDTLTKGNGSG